MAFLYQISNLCGIVIPDICIQVTTFATKVLNPAVGVSLFVILGKTTVSHICARLLFSFSVTATVLISAYLARRAISIFALVLPVTEIKQYILSFIKLELNISEGL